jgi:predicted LPLAT superfamily acyltransferase
MTAPATSEALVAPAKEGDAAWLSAGERGSILGLQFILYLCTAFGRPAARAFVKVLALYYTITGAAARKASREFLQRLEPRVTFWMVYRHIRGFAEVVLDKIFVVQGKIHYIKAQSNGFEHLRKAQAAGKGAMLLGAHMGSIEAMRVLAGVKDVPVNVLMYTGNARMINALLGKLNPALAGRIIELGNGRMDAILRVKELVDAGEIVAILGDRVGINDKFAVADFLGSPARFPTGPLLIASMLKCPVFLTFGMYTSPNKYECFLEPFADPVELPRKDRDAALAGYVQKYATRLEHFCRMSPYNWFNFYDFWRQEA